jgi:hypothetical protein
LELIYPSGESQTACSNELVNRLDLELQESGEFVILLRDNLNSFTGDYNLTLERILPQPSDSVEITYGQSIVGELTEIGAKDLYTFLGSADTRVRLQGTTSRDIRPCLELVAPDNSRETACSNDFSNELDVTLSQTGTYVVLFRSNVSGFTGNYTLSLQCISGPCG